MTFHCKNYDIVNDKCRRLHGECVPGRRGCVVEGRVALSEELEEKIKALDKSISEELLDSLEKSKKP
ncbi:MAG: hypothetical protein KKD01_15145 [Proteobacteria bacterium]|nr:hypothetical protein [Pseudomonadota bacterium]MBU1420496.1 hypothetical protein [Pseudomonadota bacterium]MBU1456059.1 hypothetical protein [Pseudomonadota bacterium]